MRVVIVSKAMLVGTYQRKAEEIADRGVELTVLIPPQWHDRRGRQTAEIGHAANYDLQIIPLRFGGHYHLYHFAGLARALRRIGPQLVHLDEEPYNLATWLGARAALAIGAVPIFFTWQNILKRYPPPFSWMERGNYGMAPAAIAGNQAGAEILRAKGFGGEVAVIPQFGVDPHLFAPATHPMPRPELHIGYAGGLLPEKGVDLLLQACAGLQGPWRLLTAGSGTEQPRLEDLARTLGIRERVTFGHRLGSQAMPAFYRSLDVLVLPSRTYPNWREQFGRVLIEAMASQVAVVGSSSGEIPHVIGEAGLIFAEEDVAGLRAHLQSLLDSPERRAALAAAGRRRVLAHFTMAQVAAATVDVYRQVLGNHGP